MMNAALEIRPDRKDAPKPYFFQHEDTKYVLLGSNIEVDLPAPFDPCVVGANGEFLLKAPNLEVAKRWVEENSDDKWQLEIKGSSGVQSHYQTERNHIHLKFGGVDFLQAVAYLALTFFAHSFPVEARQSGLDPLKALLLKDLNDDKTLFPENLAWWDGRDPVDIVGENPYEFGHAVIVGISETTSHAYAYISFFSCLNFCIDLGHVELQGEYRSVKSFIDPTSDNARDSVTELKDEQFASVLGDRAVSLHDMIHSGSAEDALKRFLLKLSDRHASRTVAQIINTLTNTAGSQPSRSRQSFYDIVYMQRQVVFNLLSWVVEDMIPRFSELPAIQQMLRTLVQADPTGPVGLTQLASHVMQLTLHLFAFELSRLHDKGELDAENLKSLFYGTTGMELVIRRVIQPFVVGI